MCSDFRCNLDTKGEIYNSKTLPKIGKSKPRGEPLTPNMQSSRNTLKLTQFFDIMN